MLESLQSIDSEIFLALNGLHADWLDGIMKGISGKWIWVPFYIVLLCLIWRRNRRLYPGNCVSRTVLGLVCIALAIALADQLCSSVLRPIFCRPRPANADSPICELVHIVDNYRGGHYGFPSCHAANSFALAAFVALFFRTRMAVFGMFGWSVLLCYSRIYLGVHYPGDLLVGAIVGSSIGGFCYWLYARMCCLKIFSGVNNKKDTSAV